MAYLKNGLFEKWTILNGLFKKLLISKIGLFQKLTYFNNGPILKIGLFQKNSPVAIIIGNVAFFFEKKPQLLETLIGMFYCLPKTRD